MSKKTQQQEIISLQAWFAKNQDKSDVWFGAQMQPPVSHSCVQKWRRMVSVPRKHYMAQIAALTAGQVVASSFYN